MARRSANSLLNSLKGKIWLATSALAFFICTFGLIAYLLATFFISETFYAVFIPFLLLSFTVMVFGWWLSNEVVSPIEKVSLLAKSLERSSLVSLPKTTGSTETDELLETLHRNSQQMQTIVGLMETVAAGNLDVALTPLQNSDRLSSSFQKLLAKVSDSIHAKQNLEKMENAVEQISEQISGVRRKNLDAKVSLDFPPTKEIVDTLNFLIDNLGALVGETRQKSKQARQSALETQKTIRRVIAEDENKIVEYGQAAQKLQQIPASVQKISEQLSASTESAVYSIEKAGKGKQAAQSSLEAISSLRRQLQETSKKINRLGECSQEITKVAKAIDDLAQRTNLISLNASIQAADNTDKSYGFSVLAEEVERLSARAENTNKEISSLNKSIAAEIGEVENSLRTTAREAVNISQFTIETGNSLGELEKYVGQFINLQTKLTAYSAEQSVEAEKSYRVFIESIGTAGKTIEILKQSESGITEVEKLLDVLQAATEDFVSAPAPEISVAELTPIASKNYAEFAEEYKLGVAVEI